MPQKAAPRGSGETNLCRDARQFRGIKHGFGWNPLSLEGGGKVRLSPRQQAEISRRRRVKVKALPRPKRETLISNEAMGQRLKTLQWRARWSL